MKGQKYHLAKLNIPGYRRDDHGSLLQISFTLLQPSAPISSAYERSILQGLERGRRAGGLERINVLGATTLLFLSESPTLSSLISFELSFCHALPRTMTQYLLSLSLSSTFYWKRRAKVESGGVSSLLSQSHPQPAENRMCQ